jgi:molybdate transport system substrate-binding protein
VTRIAALVIGMAVALSCAAAEIRVLSAAVMQTVFQEVIAEFERTTGHQVRFVYATMGAITERVLGGEIADVIIGSTPSLARLAKEDKVNAGSLVTIARVGVGAVVPAGTPKPAFATVDDVKAALRGARVVVYANPAGGGAAGIHVGKVIERLGIADELKQKTRFGAGGDVNEVTLAQGAGALGLTQISEIVGKPGAVFVGPLPDELQNYTGVTVATPSPTGLTAAFIAFLQGPSAAAAMKRRGMEPQFNRGD